MINKENKYNQELFELLKDKLSPVIKEDEETLKILEELFLTDIDEINENEIINKISNI